MSSKGDIRSIANELKTMLLNTKKRMKEKDESLKKVKSVHEVTKKEYQTLLNEHTKIKKKLQQHEEYFKSQQIQKKRKERDDFEKEKRELELKKKEEVSVLDEIKKLKKMDLINNITNKRKEKEPEESESENEEEVKQKKKKKKKQNVIDLLNFFVNMLFNENNS